MTDEREKYVGTVPAHVLQSLVRCHGRVDARTEKFIYVSAKRVHPNVSCVNSPFDSWEVTIELVPGCTHWVLYDADGRIEEKYCPFQLQPTQDIFKDFGFKKVE